MLRLLFGRYSRFVRLLEGVGILLAFLLLYRRISTASWGGADILLGLLLVQYLFVRVCALIKWYPSAGHRDPHSPQLGIEVHFLKALVPTSYILVSALLLVAAGWSWPALIVANLMMFVVSGVNCILITFHCRDKNAEPINYFTRNLYLQASADTRPYISRASSDEVSAA